MSTAKEKRIRLVTFLGKGKYEETSYTWNDAKYRTRFVAEALAGMLPADEVCVLGTFDSWSTHGEELTRKLARWDVVCPDDENYFPLGANPEEFWQQFEHIKKVLRAPTGTQVVLDITHGFRSQPFFASAAAAFVRAVDPRPTGLQVVYGAFEAKQGDITPIWDLTSFVELVDWSHNLMLFLKTGRASDVANVTTQLGRELQKAWYQNGKIGGQPRLDQLGKAMEAFGLDLETVRTGALLTDKPNRFGSAKQLLNAIDASRDTLVCTLPPLADVLDRIRQMIASLIPSERLSQQGGQRALKELGLLYWEMGRFSEAAATMREAWVTRYACDQADCPGDARFSKHHREAAEKAWYDANNELAQEIAEFRNDIEHAGYRDKPISPVRIKQRIKELLDKLLPDEDSRHA